MPLPPLPLTFLEARHGPGFIDLRFHKHEPVIIRDRMQAMILIHSLHIAFQRAWPDPKRVWNGYEWEDMP